MILTFKTKAFANITMLGADAQKLIRLMGHGGSVPGALAADDLEAAINRLRAAVEKDQQESGGASEAEDEQAVRKVSLAQRAFPLLELLEAANAAQAPVMWDR